MCRKLTEIVLIALFIGMTAGAAPFFSDDFEGDAVATTAPDTLVGGWFFDNTISGNANGVTDANEHRIFSSSASSGGRFNSKGWISNVGNAFIYKDLGLAVANTNYTAIALIDAETSSSSSINYTMDFLLGPTFATASSVAQISGSEAGGTDGKHPSEFKQLDYASGAVAGTDHLYLKITRTGGSPYIFVDDVTVEMVENLIPPVAITSFSASETAVYSNQTVTLSWDTTNAVSVTLEPGFGAVPSSGSTNVVIHSDITYTLTATNAGGSAAETVDVSLRGLEPARVFADHMVLQRNETVPVFGFDVPGQPITVTFAGQTKMTTAGTNGYWRVDLDPMAASVTSRILTITGSTVVTMTDVLVGEVWLAAGQSNMDWRVDQSSTSPHPENYGRIRMFNMPRTVNPSGTYGPAEFAKLTPENFYVGTWELLDATTVQPQSGVAYFFANALARELAGTGPGGIDVPVGVVELAHGGTSTEAFIAKEDLVANPYLKASFEDPRGVRTLGNWTSGRIAQNLSGYVHTDPTQPHPHGFAPGFLYYVGMTHIVPFTFKGAIWYQGESNAEFTVNKYKWNGDRLSDYQTMVMETLVDSWRNAFGNPDLPFYMVQLPRINASNRALWPWYREAQNRAAQNRDGVETVVVIEHGVNGSNVHPANKEPVGERLAYVALNKQYGRDIAYSGPVYTHQEIVGGKIVLHFDHVEDGLISSDGGALRHFEISGEDRTFVAATAMIVGDTVEVSAPSVPEPVAVRYGWHMNIDVNFYNSNSNENLPASPFRTDNWMAAPGRVIRVACIGDSITYGSGSTNPATDSYPSQLQKILGTANFEVQNFGWPGAGIVRPSKHYLGSSYCDNALAFNPDIVICNLGINDVSNDTWGFTKAEYVEEYRDLVDAFASLSTQPLFIHWHKISPLFPGQAYYGSGREEIVNEYIGAAATVTGARTVDMHDFFTPHPEWYPDNIHPNDEGYRNVAEETFRYLSSLDPLHGDPVISEFMASNTATLQDDDGDYEDWIEISNEGRTGMIIGGHHLSDNPGDPQVWQVPAGVILEPHEQVVVFASSKDRGTITNTLHTSFTLNENGGYLGLADPDGQVLQAFSPIFPPQFPDSSYGLGAGSVLSLIEASSPLRVEVPADGTAGLSWTTPGFNDTAWTPGLAGVGYEELAAAPAGSKTSSDFPVKFDGDEIWNSTFLNGWSELNGGGTAESLNGTVLHYDHSGSGTATTLDGTATSWNTGNDGDWTLETRIRFNASPNGFAFFIGTDTKRIMVNVYGDRTEANNGSFQVSHNNLDGAFHDFRIAHDAAAGKYHVWRDGVLLTAAGGEDYDASYSESRLLFGDTTSGSFGDGYDVDIASIRYDQTGVYTPAPIPLYTDLISLDMAASMTNQNAGCYVRIPFDLSETIPTNSTLSMAVQYDDGFVAYLNGTEVARRNAPATPAWDSASAADRNDYDALVAEIIDLSEHVDSLIAGSNMLAIHALNHAVDAQRFLVAAELTATTPPSSGFQETATPGAANGPITSTSQIWLNTHFSPAEQTQPLISGDAADPDGDSIANLFEYIFGLDPRSPDATNPLWMRVEPYDIGENTEWLLTATYPVRLGLDDAMHELIFSEDLTGEWNPELLVELVGDTVNNGDGTRTLTYRDADASAAALNRFMRLSVERQ